MEVPVELRWWSFAIRGVAAIVFGVIAFVQPGIALSALILVFGVYAIINGVFAVSAGWSIPKDRNWFLIIGGVLGIFAGVITFVYPNVTAVALLALIGVWAIFLGVMEVLAAYELRKAISNEWLLALDGVVAVIFGAYVLVSPGNGAVAIVWLIGLFAIVAGVLNLALAWRLRDIQQTVQKATA